VISFTINTKNAKNSGEGRFTRGFSFKVQGSKLRLIGSEGSKQNIKTSSIRRQGPDRQECPLAEGKLAGLQ
jgi:hypothetical protein